MPVIISHHVGYRPGGGDIQVGVHGVLQLPQPEISDLGAAVVHEHVLGLEVPVDHPWVEVCLEGRMGTELVSPLMTYGQH